MKMADHSHRGMLPTGYRTRDIQVAKGVNVVRVPEPVYDEDHVFLPCPYCMEEGRADERRHLRDELAQFTGGTLDRAVIEALLAEADDYETPADKCREALG